MEEITIIVSVNKSDSDNYAELVRLADFVLENDSLSSLMEKALSAEAKKKLSEMAESLRYSYVI